MSPLKPESKVDLKLNAKLLRQRNGRAGDSKLKGFAVLTETLNTTSIGVLEEQCIKRHLKVSYEIVEERPATAMSPHKHFVMEVKGGTVLVLVWSSGP